ncbi:23S rRNA (pseudouridine(1915)-N(3))-methyltransferase RlmH [Bacteriovorax sp. Seq25_V]|uniref:23S rRNA (pseudouridine(1915)-N(3))-methyltransferase RlmH n=1 Tax=Bacteriovorax sp. Seq25_V TaxID=1201288 RepID=UPI000389FFC1|nr:23S rRNA (pseudouridine(1915)-N(3))-methyltransferase RlmH [Bacteriovorax sp. Seq25_V]EQC44828.1 putative rRNA large subunit m3Psi methyltransferase RlmH [Bacteriovorax sp. Seq25_V]
MKDLHLVVIGKLKDKNILALENDYLKRLKSPSLSIYECKGHQEDIEAEVKELKQKCKAIEDKHGRQYIVALTEHGKTMTSDKLSEFIFDVIENKQCGVTFLIGGAAGFPKDFLEECDYKLSLSPMTYPHQLARLLFVEQVYRAKTIYDGHPYHKN